MLKQDVISHYGSQVKVGRALGIGKAAVNKWPDLVPRNWAAEIHFRTRGKLRFDPSLYPGCPEFRPNLSEAA
jgi:hypothetical protein